MRINTAPPFSRDEKKLIINTISQAIRTKRMGTAVLLACSALALRTIQKTKQSVARVIRINNSGI